MGEAPVDRLLAEQRRYYRERAPEYDDWWFRRAGYALDAETAARSFADARGVRSARRRPRARRRDRDLDPASPPLRGSSDRRRRRRRGAGAEPSQTSGAADYVLADVFEWEPPREFDVCFFGFWLSHVPSRHFEAFWQLVGRALKPDGRVFLVDNARLGGSSHLVSSAGEVARRRLSDGREFDIVKRSGSRRSSSARWRPSAGA